MCSLEKAASKFRNIYRKTPVLESLFDKVVDLNICEQLLLIKHKSI